MLITDAATVFGDDSDLPGGCSQRPRGCTTFRAEKVDAAAGTKATFLPSSRPGSYSFDDPFVRLALHPDALAVANGYLRLQHLRALDLWLTKPTQGPAIQTQLWHRDADDVINVKMFVYFTDVTPPRGRSLRAGHAPARRRRQLPERDDQGRPTTRSREVVPEREWVLCQGRRARSCSPTPAATTSN